MGNSGAHMTRAPYPTDLTDAQWARIAPLLPPPKPGGRPRDVDVREVVNAALYRNRGGCSWRLLPQEFPPWQTVYTYVRCWQRDGTWTRLLATLNQPDTPNAGPAPPPERRGR
jgi:putative transposase